MHRLLVASVVALMAGVMVSLALGAWGAAPAGRWVVRDLGTIAGLQSAAVGINEQGQVVGNAGLEIGVFGESYGEASRAFVWEKGRITPLGDLGGGYSRAVAINDRGEIIGSSRTANGELHAFLWRGGRMTDLGTLPGDGVSYADALNNRGQVAVNSYRSEAGYPWGGHAFLWQSGTKRSLGVLPGARFSRGVAINERGQIAGLSTNSDSYPLRSRPFVWQGGRMRALPTPEGQFVSLAYPHALAINGDGQVIATIEDRSGGNQHAVLWWNRHMTLLGEGFARAINDHGQVVFGSKLWLRGTSLDLGMTGLGINERGQVLGWRWKEWQGRSDPQSQECVRAAVWQNGKLTELGALGTTKPCNIPPYINNYAADNNDRGLIVGFSDTPNPRNARAVLWTRQPD